MHQLVAIVSPLINDALDAREANELHAGKEAAVCRRRRCRPRPRRRKEKRKQINARMALEPGL